MSSSKQPYSIRFGDDRRRSAARMDTEIEILPGTHVELRVNPERRSGLVDMGRCRIHGSVDDLAYVGAAFARIVDEIRGQSNPIGMDTEDTLPRECEECHGIHRPDEAHLRFHSNQLVEQACQLMIKVWAMREEQVRLAIYLAYLAVVDDQCVAARMMLHMFVIDRVANEVVDLLVEAHLRREEGWQVPPPKLPQRRPQPAGCEPINSETPLASG